MTRLFFFILKNYVKSSESNGSKLQPSFVVHARNLAENVSESNLRDALEKYGIINLIVMMPKKRQALVEFGEITSAISCVNDANRSGIFIGGHPAYMNYANTQRIVRDGLVSHYFFIWDRIKPGYSD